MQRPAGGPGEVPVRLGRETARASARGRSHDRPLVVQVGQSGIIGILIVVSIENRDVEVAAREASKHFQTLLDSKAKWPSPTRRHAARPSGIRTSTGLTQARSRRILSTLAPS